MSSVTVTFDDVETDYAVTIVFLPPDREAVEEVWNREDELLVTMQSNPLFAGSTRWSQLTPAQFRFLISRNFDLVATLDRSERGQVENITVNSLNFLVLAYVKRLEELADIGINQVTLVRSGALKVDFSMVCSVHRGHASLFNGTKPPKPEKKPSFKLVDGGSKE